jgi:tripeptidyl-peptidase-1
MMLPKKQFLARNPQLQPFITNGIGGKRDIRITGEGTIGNDLGNDSLAWWACKLTGCWRPHLIVLSHVVGVRIDGGLHMRNSPNHNIEVDSCHGVRVDNIDIRAPHKSPNTDGINFYGGHDQSFTNSYVSNGDDCVSVVPINEFAPECVNSDARQKMCRGGNVIVRNISCIGGHGISIGGVRHGTVSNVSFTNMTATGGDGDTQGKYSGGGLRVKSYPNGTGSVYDILYEDILLDDVYLPLQLLGRYCPWPCNTPDGNQSVAFHDITFRRIRGHGRSDAQANFDCSPFAPCNNIVLDDVVLGSGRKTKILCANVESIKFVNGSIPSICSSSSSSGDSSSSAGTISASKDVKESNVDAVFVPFTLVAGLRHRNSETLESAFWAISTPSHKDYLQHLSLSEIAGMVGSSAEDIAAVKRWFLDDCGATSVSVSALRDTVTAHFDRIDRISGTHGSTSGTTAAAVMWKSQTAALPLSRPTSVPLDFLMRKDPLDKSSVTEAVTTKSTRAVDHAKLFGSYTIAAQKSAYGIPADLQATNDSTLQMVWGPGTFGFSESGLEAFKEAQCPLLNTSRVNYDTTNHGSPGGDNFGEGTLDTHMISSFGLNVHTLVSNTNTSSSTEEGKGFGLALLDFVTSLAARKTLPQVLSISLGSLGAYSCDLLCDKAAEKGVAKADCNAFLQEQRQVCMFLSQAQVERIHAGFKVLGARGVSVFGSSGDGGSHFSFQPFSGGNIADVLNEVSCEYAMPVFPTASPYVTSVGGTDWQGFFSPDPTKPEAWSGSGGGFSWQFPMPAHQTATVNAYVKAHAGQSGFPEANVAFNASGRAYPDISAVAVDGTSQSSPTMAGIFSLITDHRLNAGLPPLGFLGPRLWQVNEQHPGEAFESVSKGNTKTSCDTGFPASETKWDPVTGWGRPVWKGMLQHFGADNL